MNSKATGIMLFACGAALMAQTYSIKGPASPKPHEANAMKELGDYLARRIDGTLSIGGKSPITFHVGDTDLAKAKECLSTQLKEEQWIIKSFDNNVILNGGGTRGALYAVYHFLEEYCDIHWWNEYEEYVPKASSLELPPLDATGKPAFIYRDIYCYNVKVISTHGDTYMPFAIRNRLNRAGDMAVTAEFGGSFDYGPPYHCHTFHFYVPDEKYFKDHPEYFPLKNGRRVSGKKGHLCLTNPALKDIILKNLLDYIEQGMAKAREANVPPPRIYDISQNDVKNGFCECPECQAEINEYGQSGYLLRFVNWIAEQAEKSHPEIFISTLAYYESETPPKGGVRARDNVIVKLCDTKTNQAASILEEDNKMFKELVAGWKEFAKNIFIWDYAITFRKDFTGVPFASEFHYGDLFRHYHQNNVTGVFWEHERLDRADMYELKLFLETRLMEDPCQDAEKLIDIFMPKYYGAAAPFILNYRRALDEKRKLERGQVKWFARDKNFLFIDDETIVRFNAILDQAEAAVKDDPLLLLRVRRVRLGLYNLMSHRGAPLFHNGRNAQPVKIHHDSKDAVANYLKIYDEWTSKFPNANDLQSSIRDFIVSRPFSTAMVPPPEELRGRSFIDCYPMHIINESPKTVELVKDHESPVGESMRIDVAQSTGFKLPFSIGVYDFGNSSPVVQIDFTDIPNGEGYHWYKIPATKMPSNGYAFASNALTGQLIPPPMEIFGKIYEVWFSAKHVGEQFHKGQGKPEYIYVDRVVFVEPEL